MNIYQIAAIATIVAAVFTRLQFFDGSTHASKGTSSVVERAIEKEKVNITLSLDMPEYSGERKWLFAMYDAAISMPYASTKSDSLTKVVKSSLKVSDFNMAILAAEKSPYSSTKAEMLDLIVNSAIAEKETVGYAVVAADKMPYASSKSVALKKVIKAYEVFAKETKPVKQHQTVNKSIERDARYAPAPHASR